jgi:hypothetical protein
LQAKLDRQQISLLLLSLIFFSLTFAKMPVNVNLGKIYLLTLGRFLSALKKKKAENCKISKNIATL